MNLGEASARRLILMLISSIYRVLQSHSDAQFHLVRRAMQEWQGVWTVEDLNKFLLEPMLTTPGVFMEVPGVLDETERTDLIAYLRTLSDKPIPLP